MGSRKPQTSALASSPSSSSVSEFEWDVFLNFRGEDTRKGFADHLYQQLKSAGVRTFRDKEGLKKGETIKTLLEKIRRSRVFIAVFSKSYAQSKWCLMELTEMVKCGRLLLPVFFHVHPSDVRNQTGPYRLAFIKYRWNMTLDKETVTKWRKALKRAGENSGFNIATMANGHEATLVQEIVGTVLNELNKIPLDVATYPVGLEHRVTQILKMLDMEAEDVHMIGIHGMGGIGKTTLAKAVYNEIFQKFDGSIFISDVKDASEDSKQLNRLASMQNQMICDILKDRETTVRDVSAGKVLIQQRLRGKKVLIVLDDVDHKDQLDALVERKDWFHERSRVIITTRDIHILRAHGLHEMKIYTVEELSDSQSLQLFCCHAFGTGKPHESFADLSKTVVKHTGNLPLALKVIGIFLSDKGDATLWKSALERLEKCPNGDITGRLKISYDGLEKDEQQVFLDLACVFKRIDQEYATYIWNACDFSADIIIRNLTDKALIKVNSKGELEMHDLLQKMGKQIVRQENSSEPWRRTRLWKYSDILSLLNSPKECKKVEGISIDVNEEKECAEANYLTAKALEDLHRLRLLRINHASFDDNLQDLPMKLKWLEWKGCPLKSLPQGIDLQNIVVLDLSNGRIESVNKKFPLKIKPTGLFDGAVEEPYIKDDPYQSQGQSRQFFRELKVLNLKACKYLKTTPNFASAPEVVKLVFDGCYQLVEIDESIGNLQRLVYLSMRRCERLHKLPDSINLLLSLEVFILEGCSQFSTLPEQLGGMKSLKELDLRGTRVKSIPMSIGELTNLEKLLLCKCNSLVSLPNSLGCLKSLQVLSLSNTAITEIPKSVVDMTNLQKLDLRNCKSLVPLPSSDGSSSNLTRLCLVGDFVHQDYQIDFDVFMNFSEEGTDFADHLLHALRNRGIRVFVDQDISEEEGVKEQCDAIGRSEIFIPIFSKDYAKSRRCLTDISSIVACKRLIIPVFLDVEPMDIMFQRGPFEEAFQGHEEDRKLDGRTVNRWRAGLEEAGRAVGYHFNLQANWRENEQIEEMTERVFSAVNKLPLDEPKHTIGIDSRVDDVLKMLSIETNDVTETNEVRTIGIYGMGGIGKTTLAKAVYNKMHRHFEGGSCFILNVRKACRQVGGLVSLQATLAHNISKSEALPISSVEQGIAVIREKIRNRKVLIVLDDIDHPEQLDALVGSRQRFGLGSRIIITTRDKRILLQHSISNCQMYLPRLLNDFESLHLFCRLAFMADRPKEGYPHLEAVASATYGIPVVIEIVGSHLSRAFGEKKWMEILQYLKQVREYHVLEWLRVIYNELEESEREIFLDVACFLVGKDAENAICMWKDCGYLPHTEESHQVLLRNPFVKINARTNEFEMHDIVRELGRELARQSRLWYTDENSTGETTDVQGLLLDAKLDYRWEPEGVHHSRITLPTMRFHRMVNLRLLHIANTDLEGDFRNMPKGIKWLQWTGCFMESLPSDFDLEMLVILDLSNSSIKQVWQGNRKFPKLKVLNLSGCVNLVECPDFISVPCLEKLVLDYCDQLPEVNESISRLQSLVHLTASHCTSLRSLPENICRLWSLRVLKINGCCGISSLPLQMEKMKSLEELDISFTSIERIPYSLGCLANLKTVKVTGCESILASMSSFY